MDAPESLARAAPGLVGIAIVLLAIVFANQRKAFGLVAGPARPYAVRDRRLAWFAPVGLLLFPVVVIAIVITGYTLIFWSLGLEPGAALRESGSSPLTLGFAVAPDLPSTGSTAPSNGGSAGSASWRRPHHAPGSRLLSVAAPQPVVGERD